MTKAIFATLILLLASQTLRSEEPILPSVVGGKESAQGAYPWMVALVRTERENIPDGQFCGGVLIHPYWILTAAHCVDEYNTGIIEVAVSDGNLAGQVDLYEVGGIFIHPEADLLRIGRSCDIALIRLKDPILGVTPIPLERAASALGIGKQIRNLGWGATLYNSDSDTSATLLKEVDGVISAIENEDELDPVHDYFVKVIGVDPLRGTYHGDSGGPLLVRNPDDGEWRVAGVTSYGQRAISENHNDNFYAKVSYAADWIDAHVKPPLASRPDIVPTDRITLELEQNGLRYPHYKIWPFADGPRLKFKRFYTQSDASEYEFTLRYQDFQYNLDGSFTFTDYGDIDPRYNTLLSLIRITQLGDDSYGNAPIPIVPFERAVGYSPNGNQLSFGKRGIVFELTGLQTGHSYTYPTNGKVYALDGEGHREIERDWVPDHYPRSYRFTAEPETCYLVAFNQYSSSPRSYSIGILPFDATPIGIGETLTGTLSSESNPYLSPHTRAELLEYKYSYADELKLELHSVFDAQIQLFNTETAEKIGYYDVASENETETFIFSNSDFESGKLALFNFDKDIFGDFTATLSKYNDPVLNFGVETKYAVTSADESFPDPDTGETVYFETFEMRGRYYKDHMKVEVYTPYGDLGIAVYSDQDLVEFIYGDSFTQIEFPTEVGQAYEIFIYDIKGFRNVNFEINVSDSKGATLPVDSGDSDLPLSKYKKSAAVRPSNALESDDPRLLRFLKAHLDYRNATNAP